MPDLTAPLRELDHLLEQADPGEVAPEQAEPQMAAIQTHLGQWHHRLRQAGDPETVTLQAQLAQYLARWRAMSHGWSPESLLEDQGESLFLVHQDLQAIRTAATQWCDQDRAQARLTALDQRPASSSLRARRRS